MSDDLIAMTLDSKNKMVRTALKIIELRAGLDGHRINDDLLKAAERYLINEFEVPKDGLIQEKV